MGRAQRVWDFVTFNDLPAARVREARVTHAPAEVRGIGNTPLGYTIGRPQWPTANPRTYVREGYAQVVTAYRAVNLIANAVGSAPVRVYQEASDGTSAELPLHPMRQVMSAPNPFMSESEFLTTIVKIAATTGVCVIEKERSASGRVAALWPLRTDWLRPVPRADGSHDWQYGLPDGQTFELLAEDVIHFVYESDPFGSPFGMAPLGAALRELAIENALVDFTKTFLQRGAVPQYGLIPREGAELEQHEVDALRERWQQRYGGITNAAEVAVLAGIEDVKRIGLDYNELAYTDLRALTAVQICSALGVPPILIGAKPGLDASTYSNYEQARLAFWQDTVTPLLARLDGALTRGLLAEFADRPGLTLEFDTSDVPALQTDTTPTWTRVGQAVAQGWLTVNDARREVGLPEVRGGDVFLRSIAQIETTADPQRAARHGVETRARVGRTARQTIARLGDAGAPKVERFFAGQLDRLLKHLGARSAAGPGEWRAIEDSFDWEQEARYLAEVLHELHVAAGMAAYDASAGIGLDVSWSLANPRIRDLMRELGQRVVDISETSRAAIQETVTEALLEGVSMPDLAERLRGLYEETYRGRSLTIARTESQVAYNGAAAASYRESGLVTTVQLLDNPDHADDYGASDGLTCAERNGLLVPLENAELHIEAEHPNGTLAIAPVIETGVG